MAGRMGGAPMGPEEDRFSIATPRVVKPGMRAGGDAVATDWQTY